MHMQQIEQLIIHKVGNTSQHEGLFLSDKTITLNEELNVLLSTYFSSSFEHTELYHFYNNVDLKFNTIYALAKDIFDNPSSFQSQSAAIAQHLFDNSQHPKIKGGELYIASFNDSVIDGESCRAIGIFKSENKDTFLKIYPEGNHLNIASESGINIQKLDKGCIIYNVQEEDGYKVAVVDKTNKGNETVFWFDDFLSVRQTQDNYFHTEKAIELCNTFVQKILPEQFEVNKADQADILTRSAHYFKAIDTFNFDEFASTITDQDLVKESFKSYKEEFESTLGFEIEDNFEISDTAYKKKQKYLKSVLKLDKNFSIYVHGNTALMEHGVDEMGRKFYKFYYDNEA